MKRIIYILLFLSASVNVALAQVVIPLEEVTFSDWRYIMSDEERTPSDCIGIMKSPLCAIDTNIACDAWTKPRGRSFSHTPETLHPICTHAYEDYYFKNDVPIRTLFGVHDSHYDYRFLIFIF